VRAVNRGDSLLRSGHVNVCHALPAEEVQEKFAGRSAQACGRFAPAQAASLVRSCPHDLEPDAAEATAEKATPSAHVSPQCNIHRRRNDAQAHSVRAPNVLVMNEELVQVRKRANPTDPEESGRRPRPDPIDEPAEVVACNESNPPPLGKALKRTGRHDKTWSGK
jgi:hypothetical protein